MESPCSWFVRSEGEVEVLFVRRERLRFCSFVGSFVLVLVLVVVGSGRRTLSWSSCSWRRVSRCSPETPLVGRSACHFPLPVRTEIAARTRSSSPKAPSELSRGRLVQARGTSPVDHAGGTRSCGRKGLDDVHREVATSFSFGVFV